MQKDLVTFSLTVTKQRYNIILYRQLPLLGKNLNPKQIQLTIAIKTVVFIYFNEKSSSGEPLREK